MNHLNRGIILAFFLFGVPVAFGTYQVGDTVADFTLPDAYGNPVSFSDFDGKVVVINFWTST